jgi:dsDNA-specific endonuclease/ATPase MutS2
LPKDDSKERLEKTQDKLDKELALQQVMLQDPIIAEADPKEVQELYNTISEISPRFAKNPRMMTTALKEAL